MGMGEIKDIKKTRSFQMSGFFYVWSCLFDEDSSEIGLVARAQPLVGERDR